MGLPGDIFQFMSGQILGTPVLPSADLTGQTMIITGANSGLGLEAAKHIYKLNVSHLILACRNAQKGETARKEVLASGRSSSPGIVEVWQLDMADYSSMLAFGERIKNLPRLDSFLANAGIDTTKFLKIEGHESTITVNVISTILVGLLAIPKLRETSAAHQKQSRLVFTGSQVHVFAKNNQLSKPGPGQIFKSLDNEATADMTGRYYLSKLVLLLAVRKLAKQLSQPGVIVNFVGPGWCKTDLFRTNDGGMGGRIGLRLIGRTSEEGSRTLVHGAVADEDSHGKYLSECKVKQESTWSRSEEGLRVEERLWVELVDILEAVRPGVSRV